MVRTDAALSPPPLVELAGHPVRWQLLTALADSDYRVRELVAHVGQPQNLVLLRRRCSDGVQVISAGTQPKAELQPDAVGVLREEFGIDAAEQRPRHLDRVCRRRFDHVITLCDKGRDACPPFAGSPRRSHWSVPDPASVRSDAAAGYLAFRLAAEGIHTRVRHLMPVLVRTARGA